jgi:glycosyltransferase involved in cell wall biosynthesis
VGITYGVKGYKMISIIIPVYNGEETIGECLRAVSCSEYQDYECIVVDDGSNDDTLDIASKFPFKTIRVEKGPLGPANARNYGVEHAQGEFILFIDADVIIKPDTLTKVINEFEKHPETAALFGSYDENPASLNFVSQYKNLIHHFVHQQGHDSSATFWSGCGAIRREIFIKLGGFDAKQFPRPSIEDIDLGYRLKEAGYSTVLRRDIQVTHLKAWSLFGLINTDIFYRAVPWTALILRHSNIPNDLNLGISQRVSTVLLLGILLYVGIFTPIPNLILLLLITGLFLSLMNVWYWAPKNTDFKMTSKGEKLTYFLIGAVDLVALYQGESRLIFPLTILLPLLIIGRFINVNRVLRFLLFTAIATIIILEFTILFMQMPLTIVLPLLIILMLVLLINNRLYVFLVRKHGFIFALAALPLQILYYLYSLVSFILTVGVIYWNNKLRIRSSKP